MQKKTICSYCGNESLSNICSKRRAGEVMKPFMDWSFKYLFGNEENKPNLIGFLNLMLMPESPIEHVDFMNNESLPLSEEQKGCVFDILCKDKNGEQILIEVQNRQVGNMKERIIYYTCRLIDRMGRRGTEWDYQDIKKVYSICILNFNYEPDPVLRRDIRLYDGNTQKLFSDKLNIILIQMPCANGLNFSECNNYYEYLLSLLQQMQNGMKTKEELKQEVADTQLPQGTKELFYKILDTADYATLSEEEQLSYESNLKHYMDTMSCIRFAKAEGTSEGFEQGLEKGIQQGMKQGLEQGREEGREEGIQLGIDKRNLEIARCLKSKGLKPSLIAESTGLTVETITQL